MSLILLSPPSAEPVTLSEVKDHLRITHDDEDALITGILVSASRSVEARGGLALTPQSWRLTLDAVPEETITLPLHPVTSIDSVSVLDSAGAAHMIDAALYEIAAGSPGRLRRAGPWPAVGVRLDGVRIDFTAGYVNAADVPEPLKQAVKILAAHFYEMREAASDTRILSVPQGVDTLIAPFREVRL